MWSHYKNFRKRTCGGYNYFIMSDSDDSSSTDALKRAGITQYEFTQRLKATLILTTLMHNIKENSSRENQTHYLLNDDIMSDEEWDLYIDLRWPGYKDDIN